MSIKIPFPFIVFFLIPGIQLSFISRTTLTKKTPSVYTVMGTQQLFFDFLKRKVGGRRAVVAL